MNARAVRETGALLLMCFQTCKQETAKNIYIYIHICTSINIYIYEHIYIYIYAGVFLDTFSELDH